MQLVDSIQLQPTLHCNCCKMDLLQLKANCINAAGSSSSLVPCAGSGRNQSKEKGKRKIKRKRRWRGSWWINSAGHKTPKFQLGVVGERYMAPLTSFKATNLFHQQLIPISASLYHQFCIEIISTHLDTH